VPRRGHIGGHQARPTCPSLPDARAIADDLTQRQVRLNLGGSVYDPTDPVGRLLFNGLAMVAEFSRLT
jgi:DNA invertase Pin-like site-specific DNA recombinase